MHIRPGHLPRAIAVCGATLAMGLAGAVSTPAAAHAATVDITCLTGSRHTEYTPPLTNDAKPEHLDITDNFSCVSLLGGVSSGSAHYSTDLASSSCLLSVFPPTTSATRTYHWNTGQSSDITFSATTAVRAADGTVTVTSIGAVTSGLGQGQAVVLVTVEPNLNLTACAGAGLSATNSLSASLVVAPV